METKSVKITPPDGYIVDEEKSTFGEIMFKPVEKKKLPKTWEELGKVEGYYIDSYSTVNHISGEVTKSSTNTFPTKEYAEAALALAQLLQLRKAWIDILHSGWEPKWLKSSKINYCIHLNDGIILVNKRLIRYRVLSFPTEEMALDFLNTFKDLIEKALPIL